MTLAEIPSLFDVKDYDYAKIVSPFGSQQWQVRFMYNDRLYREAMLDVSEERFCAYLQGYLWQHGIPRKKQLIIKEFYGE